MSRPQEEQPSTATVMRKHFVLGTIVTFFKDQRKKHSEYGLYHSYYMMVRLYRDKWVNGQFVNSI